MRDNYMLKLEEYKNSPSYRNPKNCTNYVCFSHLELNGLIILHKSVRAIRADQTIFNFLSEQSLVNLRVLKPAE